jgi:hypothetical protein
VEIMQGSTEMWVRMPRPMRKKVVEVARRYGETQSTVVVKAIRWYLSEQLGIAIEEEMERLP